MSTLASAHQKLQSETQSADLSRDAIPDECLNAVIAQWKCRGGLLDPQGPFSANEMFILVDASLAMLAIMLPTILATIAFAWWFGASNARATYRPNFVYSGRIELVVWSIPLMVILLLGGVSWLGSYQPDPAAPISHR